MRKLSNSEMLSIIKLRQESVERAEKEKKKIVVDNKKSK